MKLTGLNRSFVTLGLKQFEKGANLGIQALASVAGVKDGATATTLGFHLGPRINAGGRIGQARSEEHTSELQSLMRISYAVFYLKTTQVKTQTHNATKIC